MRKPNRGQQGFSLVETVIVVAIIMVVTATAVIQTAGSLEASKCNNAMDTVMSQLRVARQLAISQRRNVQVFFNPSDNFYNPPLPSVSYQVLAGTGVGGVNGGANGPVVKMPLLDRATYMGFAGMTDTPMGFGTCAGNYALCVGGVQGGPGTMQFNATGQFTDFTGVTPLNGTIFIGIPDAKLTSVNMRAVTIMGATGRVRSYAWLGSPLQWQE